MEGDQVAALSIQAAAFGLIDYSKADIKNRAWWRSCNLVFRGLAQRLKRELAAHRFNFNLALLSGFAASDKTTLFDKRQAIAQQEFGELESVITPWQVASRKEQEKTQTNYYREQWKSISGFDLQDKAALDAWAQQIDEELDKQALKYKQAEQNAATWAETVAQRMQEIRKNRLRSHRRRG